jgi:DNA replication factor GINS
MMSLKMGIVLESVDKSIVSFVQDRLIKSELENVKILFKQELPNISTASLKIEESKEGDLIEVPRWVAEVLMELGFAEIQEESFEVELLQTLSRERIQSSNHLSAMTNEFHVKLKRYLDFIDRKNKLGKSKVDYEESYLHAHDLITLRIAKILPLTVGEYTPELIKKLTPEEIKLFNMVRDIVQQWKSVVLEGVINE